MAKIANTAFGGPLEIGDHGLGPVKKDGLEYYHTEQTRILVAFQTA